MLDRTMSRLEARIEAVSQKLDRHRSSPACLDLDRMSLKHDFRGVTRDLKRTFVTWLLITDALGVAAVGTMFVLVP